VRFVVVFHVVMIHIMIMVLTTIIGTIASHLLKLVATLPRASAVFSVALNCVAKFVLCRLNASFAVLPPLVTVVCACGKCRSHQANNCQQSNTEKSDSTSHVFSFNSQFTTRIVSPPLMSGIRQ
jgi:hypothetical protein